MHFHLKAHGGHLSHMHVIAAWAVWHTRIGSQQSRTLPLPRSDACLFLFRKCRKNKIASRCQLECPAIRIMRMKRRRMEAGKALVSQQLCGYFSTSGTTDGTVKRCTWAWQHMSQLRSIEGELGRPDVASSQAHALVFGLRGRYH